MRYDEPHSNLSHLWIVMTTFHCDTTPVWFNETVSRWLKEDASHYEDEAFWREAADELPPDNLSPVCDWVNDEIIGIHPDDIRPLTVALMLLTVPQELTDAGGSALLDAAGAVVFMLLSGDVPQADLSELLFSLRAFLNPEHES